MGQCSQAYDFIFIDGAKNWSTDGLAVLLAERLLQPGGWLLLDDLGWSYDQHSDSAWHYEIEVAKLSKEERAEPHLRAVYDLLTKTNPAFDQFLYTGRLAGLGAEITAGNPAPGPGGPSGRKRRSQSAIRALHCACGRPCRARRAACAACWHGR